MFPRPRRRTAAEPAIRGATRILALSIVLACAVRPGDARAEDPRQIGLVDQNGATFRLRDLAGTPTLITFVASRCNDACPIANAAFFRLRARFTRERRRVRLVTITLDPTFDTPFVMAGVGRRFSAEPERWRFASGPVGNVRAILRAFAIRPRAGKDGVPEQHATFVYVLNDRVELIRTLLLSTALGEDAERALDTKAGSSRAVTARDRTTSGATRASGRSRELGFGSHRERAP